MSKKASGGREIKVGSKMIKSVVRDGENLRVVFNDERMDPAFVNGLRRLMIGESPAYSLMGPFTIHLNTSMLNDEYVMTRIQMIPLMVEDLDDLSLFDEKPVFHLCAPGDRNRPLLNENDLDLMVTAHMFQIFDASGNLLSDDDKYDIKKLIKYDLPLLKLRKGQEFHLEVEPLAGIGRNHASFKSAQIEEYKFGNPVSEGDKKVSATNPITGLKLESIADKQGYAKNKWGNPEVIRLEVNTNGHYSPENALRLALRMMEDKLLRLQVLVDNRIESRDETQTRVEIIPSTDIENYVRIKVIDPDHTDMPLATHTIGALLAAHMSYRLDRLVKGKMDMIRESMTSYQRPHPLDEIIYLNIKTPYGLYGKDYRGNAPERLLDETIGDLLNYLAELKKAFEKI